MATVRYLVNNVDDAAAFYARLGFEQKGRFGPVAILHRGDLEFWVSGPGASAMRPVIGGAEPGPGGWNRFVIEVDDIDVMVGTLKAAHVTFRSDIIEGPGGKQILIEDPSGNPVEIFQHRGA